MSVINHSHLLSATILLLALAGCSNNEIGESKDINQETIYQYYGISYDENENGGQAVIFAQFRFAGEDGTTLVLTKPSKITFDGSIIKVDSNDNSGAFYKLFIPAKNLFGKHQLVFTDINNKKFENDFLFDDFRIAGVPAITFATQPLMIKFETKPLQGDDYLELSSANTDSSFTINYVAADTANVITIPVSELQRQKGKVFSLLATLYKKMPLLQSTKEGGQIVTVHTLKPVIIRLMDSMQYASAKKF